MAEDSVFPPERVSMVYYSPIVKIIIFGYKHGGDLTRTLRELFNERGLPKKVICDRTTEFGMNAVGDILSTRYKNLSLHFDESKKYAIIS